MARTRNRFSRNGPPASARIRFGVGRVEPLERRRLFATSVQGSVIEDENANGVFDADDTLPIWTPTIFADLNYNGSLDAGEPSTTQSFSNSNYRLELPGGGTYLIRVILPDSYVATLPASGTRTITIQTGFTTLGNHFGGWRTGRYAARPFEDINGNGAQDSGEFNLFRRALWADLDRDGVMDPIEPASTPGGSGGTSQLALRPGSYNMRLDTPPGWTNTTAPDGVEHSIEPGIANFPEPLGQQATRNVLGTVAQDDNGSEQLDPSDTVLAGWTVFADLNKNGVREGGEPFDVTEADGTYALISSALGTSFNLRLVSPGGQLNSFSRSYGSGHKENAFGNDDVLLRVTNVAQGRLFGDLNGNGIYESTTEYREYFAPGQIVYADVNDNGQRDAGEAMTRTDAGGTFLFAVPNGTYSIRPEPDDDYAINPAFPAFAARSFSGNVRATLGSLGLVDNRPSRSHAHVQGIVFNDLNRNSRWDPGEQPQGGQTVYIDWNANLRRDVDEPTTVSGADGRYLLPDMQTSTGAGPIIRVETPSGWRNTQSGLGEGLNVQIYSGQGASAPLGIYAVPDVGIATAQFDVDDRRSLYATFTHDLGPSLQGGDFVLLMFFNGTWVETSAQFAVEASIDDGRSVATLRLSQPLPDGEYRVRLLPQAIADVVGTKNVSAQDVEFTLAPPVHVTDVFVAGTGWSPSFLNFLGTSGAGDAQFGYRVDPADPTDELPWTNLNSVSLRFSEDVTVTPGAFAIYGVNVAQYGGLTFAYDPTTFTATWTLPAATVFDRDKLLLHVEASGVTDGDENALPDDYQLRLNVLPGDVNGSGTILGTDVTLVRNAQGSAPGTGLYSVFKDVNGSASILGTDVTQVRNRQGTSLPAGEPAAPAPDVAITHVSRVGTGRIFATGSTIRRAVRLLAQRFDLLGDEVETPLVA